MDHSEKKKKPISVRKIVTCPHPMCLPTHREMTVPYAVLFNYSRCNVQFSFLFCFRCSENSFFVPAMYVLQFARKEKTGLPIFDTNVKIIHFTKGIYSFISNLHGNTPLYPCITN